MEALRRWSSPSRVLWLGSGALIASALLGPVLRDVAAFHHVQLALGVLLLAGWWQRSPDRQLAVDPRAWRVFLVVSLVWLEAVGVTRFLGFWVNGVDFSIFDWMLESTHRGRFGYSPIYEVNHFGVHSSFILLLWVPLHELVSSPWWLVLSGPLVVWLGLFPLMRLARLSNGGPHGALEVLLAFAWISNPWVGRALHGGFRPELLLPLLTLWFLVGWIERNSEIVGLSFVALLCTKEDSVLFLVGFVIAGTLVERWRWKQALTLVVLSAGWLLLYVAVLQPRLTGRSQPGYWTFWSDFGSTPRTVLEGMLAHPWLLVTKVATSRWWAFFLPLLLLPLRSLRALGGLAPTVLLLGAANYGAMRDYGTYYPLPLLAFALFGLLDVWAVWRSRADAWRREGVVVVAVASFAAVGASYPRAVPFELERHEALQAAWARVSKAPVVCVQPVLFPHLGYSRRLAPLMDFDCLERSGVVALIHPELDSSPQDTFAFLDRVKALREQMPVEELPGGFLVLGPRSR